MADLEALSRRAFLRGLTVTSAGLLVPGRKVFDMGRRQALAQGGKVRFILNAEALEEGAYSLTDIPGDATFSPEREQWSWVRMATVDRWGRRMYKALA